MILVDTSVWIRHIRQRVPELARLLNDRQVLGHAVVRCELAMGNLAARPIMMRFLKNLPQAAIATDDEVLVFVEANKLYGRGIGYGDAQLLASARLTPSRIWSFDGRVRDAAERLGIAYEEPSRPA